MAEKIASSETYKKMVSAPDFDFCKVVGDDRQIQVFNGERYISFEKEDMGFDKACEYLDAIYQAIMTIADDAYNGILASNLIVQVVANNANRVFIEGYEKALSNYKNNPEKMNLILKLQRFRQQVQLPARQNALSASIYAVQNLDDAIANGSVVVISPNEFQTLEAKYKREIQTS